MLRNKVQIPQSGKVIHIRVHAYLSSCRKRQSPNEPWYPCPHGVQSPSPPRQKWPAANPLARNFGLQVTLLKRPYEKSQG